MFSFCAKPTFKKSLYMFRIVTIIWGKNDYGINISWMNNSTDQYRYIESTCTIYLGTLNNWNHHQTNNSGIPIHVLPHYISFMVHVLSWKFSLRVFQIITGPCEKWKWTDQFMIWNFDNFHVETVMYKFFACLIV